MVSRKEAIDLAAPHLRDEGSSWVVRPKGHQRNKRLGLWRIGYCDPDHPDDVLCGGDLAVWDDGRVEPVGSSPEERDMVDAEWSSPCR